MYDVNFVLNFWLQIKRIIGKFHKYSDRNDTHLATGYCLKIYLSICVQENCRRHNIINNFGNALYVTDCRIYVYCLFMERDNLESLLLHSSIGLDSPYSYIGSSEQTNLNSSQNLCILRCLYDYDPHIASLALLRGNL